MAINVCLYADTKARQFSHWEFTIAESIDGWEWTHNDFKSNGVTGTCQTVFEAIEAVDEWRAEDAMADPAPRTGGAHGMPWLSEDEFP